MSFQQTGSRGSMMLAVQLDRGSPATEVRAAGALLQGRLADLDRPWATIHARGYPDFLAVAVSRPGPVENSLLVRRRGSRVLAVAHVIDFGHRVHLQHLAVDLAHEGLGLGRELLAEISERTKGRSAISVDVAASNRRARKLYERLGYRTATTATVEGLDRIADLSDPIPLSACSRVDADLYSDRFGLSKFRFDGAAGSLSLVTVNESCGLSGSQRSRGRLKHISAEDVNHPYVRLEKPADPPDPIATAGTVFIRLELRPGTEPGTQGVSENV